MITINKDRTVYIPESDRHIGFENDHLVETRYFEIADEDISDFHFKLDIADTLDIIDLEKVTLEDGRCVLVWKITSAVIGDGGIIKAQLRAFDEGGERVWHSHMMEFAADQSVNGEKQIDDERILSEFEQLETRVTDAVSKAENFADSAGTYASLAESHKEQSRLYSTQSEEYAESSKEHSDSAASHAMSAEETENRINSKISAFENCYGNADEQADKANTHYADQNNPHKVTAEQIGVYTKEESDNMLSGKADSEHNHTASEVGTYTKDEVDKLFENVDTSLSSYAKKDEVYETGSFAWTDFHWFADGADGHMADVKDDEIEIGNTSQYEYAEIVCRDHILGFKFSISGWSDAILRINGEPKVYRNATKNGDVFATDTIPLTYMTRDIFLWGSENTWRFTDMVQQKIRGVPELENKIGDIDNALDGILDIQEELIGTQAE